MKKPFAVLGTCLLISATQAGCECAYGGAGCSDPLSFGLCEQPLVVGQQYQIIFGYGSDTGISEAKLRTVEAGSNIISVVPTPGAPDVPNGGLYGPFDLNNGPGDGGITVTAHSPGHATVRVDLRGWSEPYLLELQIVDEENAPVGFQEMEAAQRLQMCLESSQP